MNLKRITELANKFQRKLGSSFDPMDFDAAKKELGAITDVKEYGTPKTKSEPMKMTAAHITPDFTGSGGISADVKAGLDNGAPGLKGMLHLTQDGKHIRVDYNAARWRHGASAVKRLLTNALPGYTIDDPIGYSNPEWTFNY